MKLINFDLEHPFSGIALEGLGHYWDLHNFAEFLGFNFGVPNNSLSLEWDASSKEGNPWGDTGNKAKGCKLVFRNLAFLKMSGRNDEMPLSEDLCLSEVSKVIPEMTEYRYKQKWVESEKFNLLFEFQSGRTLEIGAESVELQSLT